MRFPEYEEDGYPTDKTLRAIEEWPIADSDELLVFVYDAWDKHYGNVRAIEEYDEAERLLRPGEGERLLLFATGGWSANEAILSALQKQRIFWAIHWVASLRGGATVFGFKNGEDKPFR